MLTNPFILFGGCERLAGRQDNTKLERPTEVFLKLILKIDLKDRLSNVISHLGAFFVDKSNAQI